MDSDSPGAIAIRLADEGVPVAAIARATHISSAQLYETLNSARREGRLLELPQPDWPPGFPRNQRALQLSRMVVEDRGAVCLVAQQIFNLTTTEAALLLLLLQNSDVSRERIDMSQRTVDVHICHIRRQLLPHGIEIETLRGYGYQLSREHRRKAMELIVMDQQTY